MTNKELRSKLEDLPDDLVVYFTEDGRYDNEVILVQLRTFGIIKADADHPDWIRLS